MSTGGEKGRHIEIKEQSFKMQGWGGPWKALVILNLQAEKGLPLTNKNPEKGQARDVSWETF